MSEVRASIENTLYRYAWAYDVGEIEEIDGCFTTDSEVQFADTGLKRGRPAVAAEMRRRRAKYSDGSIPWHVISNVYITDASETQARVRSWFTFFVYGPDAVANFRSIGWYDDVFAPEDGAWRIHRRRILSPAKS